MCRSTGEQVMEKATFLSTKGEIIYHVKNVELDSQMCFLFFQKTMFIFRGKKPNTVLPCSYSITVIKR
jgi:hypothetical protein